MATAHKNSIKRNAILEALCATKEHPTAEMLYEKLKPAYPDLSLGTVYRNLAVFCSEGKAISVGTVEGKERFDGRTDAHPHFICKNCGRVEDVEVPLTDNAIIASFTSMADHEVEGYSLVFTGRCESCRINKI